MTTQIATATLPARPALLANPTVITPASGYLLTLLSDGTTTIFRIINQLGVSVNNGTTVTAGKVFDDSTWSFDGLIETPGGEVLASVRKTDDSLPGKLYRSTGWNKATGAATSWAVVKTFGTNGAYARSWGLHPGCVAPTWSRHAGTILVCEYGLPKPNAYKAYKSIDDGVTWTQIFDLTGRVGGDTDVHCHGITYDPWQGRVYLTFGDTTHGIYYCDNVEAVQPRWTLVPGSDDAAVNGTKQVTSMAAFETGILMGSDGYPQGVRLLPRRSGALGFGPIRERASWSGGTSTYIGGTIWRNGGIQDPEPGSPIWMCAQEGVSQHSRPVIFASTDGGQTITEAYRHATGVAVNGQTGIERVFGPMADGKVVASINVDGTYKTLVLDYLPDAPAKLPALPWEHVFAGKVQLSAAGAQTVALHESGTALASGGSGGQAGFYFDRADYAVGGRTSAKMRLRLMLDTNGTAPGVNISAALYPITSADVAADGGYLVGTVVPSSTVTIATPALGTIPTSEVEFTAPSTTGIYIVQITIAAGGMAGGSVMNLRAALRARGV